MSKKKKKKKESNRLFRIQLKVHIYPKLVGMKDINELVIGKTGQLMILNVFDERKYLWIVAPEKEIASAWWRDMMCSGACHRMRA